MLSPTPIAQQQMPAQQTARPALPQANNQASKVPSILKNFVSDLGRGLSTLQYSPYDNAASFGAAMGQSIQGNDARAAATAEGKAAAEQQAYERSQDANKASLEAAKTKAQIQRYEKLNALTDADIAKKQREAEKSAKEKTGKEFTVSERVKAKEYANEQIEARRNIGEFDEMTDEQIAEEWRIEYEGVLLGDQQAQEQRERRTLSGTTATNPSTGQMSYQTIGGGWVDQQGNSISGS